MTDKMVSQTARWAGRLAGSWDRLKKKVHLVRTYDLDREDLLENVLQNQALVDATLTHRDLAAEALRMREYTQRVLDERYWLQDVLDQKDFVMGEMDRKRGDNASQAAFRAELEVFKTEANALGQRLPVRDEDIYPQLADRTASTPFDRHYLYHPAWAARVLARTRPAEHVDISSILQFATMLSAFVPTRFYDYRPAPLDIPGLTCGAADLAALPFADQSLPSLSCMHVLEHIGLGRYGDPLDPDGDLKAIAELVRVLAPGGNLLIATPVGRPRVQFNAHRIYDHEAFASYFAPLELVEFALIEEHGERGPIVAPPPELVRSQNYGCGCFWFRRAA